MAEGRPIRRSHELNRRYRRAWRIGLLASVIFHLLVLLLFRTDRIPPSPFAAAGPRAGDDAAAAAGGAMRSLAIQPPRQEIVRPPDPIPVPDAPQVEQIEEPEPEIQPVALSQFDGVAGEREGPEQGPGLETGTGRGDGGNAERGRFRVVPPSPRGLILPPSDRPRGVRGKEIEVWVFVQANGRVVADSTRLRPPTGDSRFDRRLRQQAAEWVFEPAMRGGKPVAEWFQYVVTL